MVRKTHPPGRAQAIYSGRLRPPTLVATRRKCLCLYSYFIDRGFGFLRVQIAPYQTSNSSLVPTAHEKHLSGNAFQSAAVAAGPYSAYIVMNGEYARGCTVACDQNAFNPGQLIRPGGLWLRHLK